MKGKGKILTAVITTIALVGASFGGVTYWQKNHKPEFAVYPVRDLSTGYWGSDIQLEGRITSGAIQTFYVRAEDTVTSVLVQEGEQVKEGDVLMIMDSTAKTLQLDTDLLTLEQTKLKITQAEKQLEKLKHTSPISENGGGGGYDGWDDIIIPDPEPEPEPEPEIPAVLYSDLNPLTFDAEPYSGDGSEENPYRFLCTNGTLIQGSFLNKMAGYADPDGSGEKSGEGSYFCLEVRSGNTTSGTLETAWIQDASILPMAVDPEWTAELSLSVRDQDPDKKDDDDKDPDKDKEPGDDSGDSGSGDGGSGDSGSGSGDSGSGDSGSGSGDSGSGSGDSGSGDSGSGDSGSGDGGSGSGDSGSGDGGSGSGDSGSGDGGSENTEEGVTATSYSGQKINATKVVWSGESLAALMTALGSYGSDGNMEYTADELKKAIAAKESEIKTLQLDLKSQELQIEKEQKDVQDCYIKAQMNGTIQKIGDPESPPNDGSAFLELVGTEGIYLQGNVSELQLDNVKIGDMVSVYSWMSGSAAEAQITDISRFPSDNEDGYYGSGSAASMYPFSAVISGGNFEEGDWVQVTLSASGEQDSALYLEKSFIRDDNGTKYVYVMDEDGLLKKQTVKTGKIIWGSYYEIRSGLTQDQYIAFPYGKKIGEGAATRIGDLSELYQG